MSIIADRISCTRGDRILLTNVSFSLSAGECLILRGPNGVGKSTLLKTLAGLCNLKSGTCQIDLEKVVYLGHLNAVKGQMSVVENLEFWASLYRLTNVPEIMRHFQLESLRNVIADKLSAGQKRRLGLARVALSERQIWLLDEPTTALDAYHSTLMTQIIRTHCDKGGLVMVATHVDLDIPKAKTLNLLDYVPDQTRKMSLFLEGDF